MPEGLEVYDDKMILILSITDRLCRIIGTVEVPATDGSFTLPGWSGMGTAWAAYYPYTAIGVGLPPSVQVSGDSIIWSYRPGLTRGSGRILYGVR